MKKRLFRNKMLVVDGHPYEASLTALYEDVIHLRLTVRAGFGSRSFCTFNGLRNFDYYYNYGDWGDIDSIAVTPRLICVLIRYARSNGWEPASCKSNRVIALTNLTAKSLLDDDDTPNESAANTSRTDGSADDPPITTRFVD